jgi:biotin transporter BioY
MKQNVMLTIASLLSLLLLGLHLTDDVVRGMFPVGIAILYAALASGVLLYGMLVLAERRSGQLIMLVVSLFAVAMPVLHTRGAGVGAIAKSSGGFFFVWTLIALGMTGTFSFILSVRGLWSLRSGQPK